MAKTHRSELLCHLCSADDFAVHAREPGAGGVGAALDASAQRACSLDGSCRGSKVQLCHLRRAGRVHHDNVQRLGCLVLLQGRVLCISSSQSAASRIGCDIPPQRLINTFWDAPQVFVISASKIREQNYETLYSLMTKNKNGMVAKIVFSVPKPFQVGRRRWSPFCEQYAVWLAFRLMLTVHRFSWFAAGHVHVVPLLAVCRRRGHVLPLLAQLLLPHHFHSAHAPGGCMER